ncbi:MAG: UbiD family decarboxylase, partial [Planctomycetes bacterium]|nr:UbiD family decarboxylase [Planctomycetota bacterium]
MEARPARSLREFLRILGERNLLREITEPVDPHLEIPEIHRRTLARGGPALLFKNPKGSDFPLVTNLFGTTERVRLAFGQKPRQLVEKLARLVAGERPGFLKMLAPGAGLWDLLKVGQKKSRSAPVLEVGPLVPDFTVLPATTSWPADGGPFLTLPLVMSAHPRSGNVNLGIYRMQIYGKGEAGMHWQIHKGGGNHYAEAEAMGQSLPLAVLNGGPPALILAAIAPLPENVSELLLASMVLGERLETASVAGLAMPLPAQCEFAFLGEVRAGERRAEGPFGDHYGYYSMIHEYPVFRASACYHRKDAILSATVVGEPPQEDYYLGEYLQELLAPMIRLAMPQVIELRAFAETGFHSLAAARVRVRYHREAFSAALRILGEGQLSLTKVLMVADGSVSLASFPKLLEWFLARSDFSRDLFVFSEICQDSLDYTGPGVNRGSRMI